MGGQKSSNAITMTYRTAKQGTLYCRVLCCVHCIAGIIITVRSCILKHSIKHISTIKYVNHVVVWISQNGRTQANNAQANRSSSTVLWIRCRLRVDFRGNCPKNFQVCHYQNESSCVGCQTKIRSNGNCSGQATFWIPKYHQWRDAPHCRTNPFIVQGWGHFEYFLWYIWL